MSKLTRQDKIELYSEYQSGAGITELSSKYQINKGNIRHIIALLNRHGTGILRTNRNNYYSPELKIEIINKVLIDKHSVRSVAVA